jgi:hypothetical protein
MSLASGGPSRTVLGAGGDARLVQCENDIDRLYADKAVKYGIIVHISE